VGDAPSVDGTWQGRGEATNETYQRATVERETYWTVLGDYQNAHRCLVCGLRARRGDRVKYDNYARIARVRTRGMSRTPHPR
jgi:hypothetical protein